MTEPTKKGKKVGFNQVEYPYNPPEVGVSSAGCLVLRVGNSRLTFVTAHAE